MHANLVEVQYTNRTGLLSKKGGLIFVVVAVSKRGLCMQNRDLKKCSN
jgi:hypothetical protein